MSKSHKLAIVTLGEHVRRNILPIISKIDGIEFAGAFSRDTILLNEIAHTHKIKAYQSLDELFNDENVNIVYIASPNRYHYEYAMMAVKAKKHVICEKPLVTKREDFEKLLAAAQKENVKIFEAFMFVYHNQYKTLEKLLQDKKIGKVCSVYARFGFPHLKKENIRYSKELDGGAYFDAACYPVKLATTLINKLPVRITSSFYSEDDFEVDTSGSCMLEYGEGLNAFLDWGFGRAYKNEVEIWTSKAVIKTNRIFSKPESFDTVIKIEYQDGGICEEIIPGMNHFTRMFEEYVECLNNEKKYQNYINELHLYQNIYFNIGDNNYG